MTASSKSCMIFDTVESKDNNHVVHDYLVNNIATLADVEREINELNHYRANLMADLNEKKLSSNVSRFKEWYTSEYDKFTSVNQERSVLISDIKKFLIHSGSKFDQVIDTVHALHSYEKERRTLQTLRILKELSVDVVRPNNSVANAVLAFTGLRRYCDHIGEELEKFPDRYYPISDLADNYVNSVSKQLCEKVESEFNRFTDILGWPTDVLEGKVINLSPEEQVNFKENFVQLIGLYPNKLRPLELLLAPLEKRFSYHFLSERPTNDPEKPEWYLSLLLRWIKSLTPYITTKFQPLLNEVTSNISMRNEFISGLIELARKKWEQDLEILLDDGRLFSHAIDEVLAFDSELENSLVNPLQVCLTSPCTLRRWLELEREAARAAMDECLSSTDAWSASVSDIRFLPLASLKMSRLLSSVTARYRHLPSIEARSSFLQLQLDLLDEYHTRLVQLKRTASSRPLDEAYIGILNAAYSTWHELDDWSEDVFFSHTFASFFINSKKEKHLNSEVLLDKMVSSPFDAQRDSLWLLQDDMLAHILDYVIIDAKPLLDIYSRSTIWLHNKSQHSFEEDIQKDAACLFLCIRQHLQKAEDVIVPQLFVKLCRLFTKAIDKLLFDHIVLTRKFTLEGATIFKKDLISGLLPILGIFIRRPENLLRNTLEATDILTLSRGTLILLYDSLNDFNIKFESIQEEHKLSALSSANLKQIIKRRTDFNLR